VFRQINIIQKFHEDHTNDPSLMECHYRLQNPQKIQKNNQKNIQKSKKKPEAASHGTKKNYDVKNFFMSSFARF